MNRPNTDSESLDKAQTNKASSEAAIQSGQVKKKSRIAVATFFTSLSLIPFFIISIYEFATKPDLSSVPQPMRSLYSMLFDICFVLPWVPIILGAAALIQIAIDRKKVCGLALAISGIVITAVSYVVYRYIIYILVCKSMA